MGRNAPNPTLPLNLHVPLGEQKKRQATMPSRAFKGQVKRRPRKRSSRVIQDQVKKTSQS